MWSSSELIDSDLENHEDRLSSYKLERLSDLKIMLNLPDMLATNCSSQLTERQSVGFKKFEMLWHLGRDQKDTFDKILLKLFDSLSLPQHISLRTFVVKWLKESLLRGDLGRLLMPLLKIMLNPNTKRVSISNMHLVRVNSNSKKCDEPAQGFDEKNTEGLHNDIIVENEVYVIKMDDGVVKNHLESMKKKSPMGSLPKKIFNIATKNTSASEKMREKGLVPPTASNLTSIPTASDSDLNSIGLIVNPLEPLDHESSGFVSKSAPTSIRDSNKQMSKKFSVDSSSDYSTTSADSMSDNDEMSDDEKFKECDSNKVSYDESATAADEYFQASISVEEKKIDEIERNIVHDILENIFDSGGFSNNNINNDNYVIDSIQKSLINGEENRSEPNLAKRNSKTSIDSAQKSDCTNRESMSEHDSERGAKQPPTITATRTTTPTLRTHRQKRKNLKVCSSKKKKITKETLEKGKANVKILKKNLDDCEGFFSTKIEKLHPFHTHLLLYHSCYDTKQILYCLETFRNILTAGNSKLFICLTINTSVSETQLKHLLIRHRKSIFGKGFDGTLTNTEFNNAYRGVMYLEVLITLCLYYARSYFQLNHDITYSDSECDDENFRLRNHERPCSDDILANCKVQLAAIEMLHLIFSELISIVKEMGKGLASYVADLMIKCKVQKVILHCVLTSVHYSTTKMITSVSEKILKFNDPGDEKMHLEAIQIQLLRLLDAVIKLEHETIVQKGDDNKDTMASTSASIPKLGSILSQSPTRPRPLLNQSNNVKYIPHLTISQQPMFLTAILNALLSENLKHLHKNWTELVTSSLNCFSPDALSNIVVSIMHRLCENIDNITRNSMSQQISPDYCISQLEALTVICHFCLLDNNQQVSLSHLFNPQNTSTSAQSSSYGQIYNNILNFFLSSSPLQVGEAYNKHQLQQNATRTCVLSHLPRIVSSMAILWETELGQERLVKQQLMEFITPIALHHGCNFVAAIAVVWHERSEKKLPKNSFKFQHPASETQLSLVKLVLSIKVMPFESFVQTLNSVIKAPPQIYRPPSGLVLSTSALEFFYVYMKNIKTENLSDSWTSLMNLIKDNMNLAPPAQFMLFCILHELVKVCSPYDRKDKKDIRDLHDITTRLIDVISSLAGACLEQTTWLRRNLAVKEEVSDELRDGSLTPTSGNQQYSVEAQSILGHCLVNLLEYAFGSQEKDKITQIVTTLMYNIIPYLKNHTPKNIPFFYACSSLLATLTPYQYTRKAWRKDVFDLFLDPSFFQIDFSCLPFWRQILDNLMSYDNITFRELMSRF
jgi:hypothetical protein